MFCPTDMPIKCITGECKKYPHECSFESIFNTKLNIRLLADSSSPVDAGCTSDQPHKCYDGSCRSNP